ncbi:MAG: dihydrolipoyl dehydrogenase [Pseudomonadales bacterium]|nr:dihydrolipoyl dehydrogenase [Pseudomonadales bacterium]
MNEFDVVIIGGGPGGYAAAIRCSQLGLSVALAEQEALGGTCLNWGCIPTKSLLQSADLYQQILGAETFGISVGDVTFDLAKMVDQSRQAAQQLSQGVAQLMKKNKVKIFSGEASITGIGEVHVNGESLITDSIIVASGAEQKSLGPIAIDGQNIWGAREAMTPSKLPKKLLIVGAGAIGVEFASFYRSLGSTVTLLEVAPEILPSEDQEISRLAREALVGRGIEVINGQGVEHLESSKKGVSAVIEGKARQFDAAILSVGVQARIAGLGLEGLGVDMDGSFIRVGDHQQTSVPGIYAIGDVAGAPCLAHKATHEAMIASEAIAGHLPEPLRRERIPGCTYSAPQVASIGLREQDAGERALKIGRFPLYANGKSVVAGHPEGLIKTVFDAGTGELLGAHMIGEGVTELIQGFAVAMGLETTEQELIETIFPHPTVSEAMQESVLMAFDRPLHL